MSALRADFKKFTLEFIHPMGTSRGVLHARDTFILCLSDGNRQRSAGLGECAPLPGLSLDDRPEFSPKLQEVCDALNCGAAPHALDLTAWPAIRFGLEAALADLQHGGRQRLFETPFTQGKQAIPINGLIVMGDFDAMLQQVRRKIEMGFDCIKIKVGALDFEAECELLQQIRRRYGPQQVQLRLDANGAFSSDSALDRLQRLSAFEVVLCNVPARCAAARPGIRLFP